MSAGEEAAPKKRDRKLGDEWADWSGDPDECEAVIVEGSGKFVFFSFFLFLILSSVAFAGLYMVAPRLEQFYTGLSHIALAVVSVISGLMLLWCTLFILTIMIRRNLLPASGKIGLALSVLAPRVIWLGRMFGISRDHMGASFVTVCNRVIRASHRPMSDGDVLVLLPRCLSKEIRPGIQEICERYGCKTEIVVGGEAARAAVKRLRPRGIVGVACERDLVSGLTDVVPYFPAVGVANMREHGPCKNTSLDLEALEEAVKVFFPDGPPPS